MSQYILKHHFLRPNGTIIDLQDFSEIVRTGKQILGFIDISNERAKSPFVLYESDNEEAITGALGEIAVAMCLESSIAGYLQKKEKEQAQKEAEALHNYSDPDIIREREGEAMPESQSELAYRYSRLLSDYVLYHNVGIVEIVKLADILNRDYKQDISEREKMFSYSEKGTQASDFLGKAAEAQS